MDLLAALADRGCLHIIFRILASLDSWDLQVDIIIVATFERHWRKLLNGVQVVIIMMTTMHCITMAETGGRKILICKHLKFRFTGCVMRLKSDSQAAGCVSNIWHRIIFTHFWGRRLVRYKNNYSKEF